MAFEAFTSVKSHTPDNPSVSILRQGNFGLNTAVEKIFKERQVEYIILMYDPETNRIGFKPANPNEQGVYKLRGKRGAVQVSGVAFLKTYNIPYKERARSYPAQWNEELGMLVIQLQDQAEGAHPSIKDA